MTAVAGDAALGPTADPFRLRLLDGLAASIGERGYRATTVADIVRHARTSKRTFYDQFASKEECFLELLRADIEKHRREHPGRGRSRSRLAPADSSGRRGLRRQYRVPAGHHAELDS